MLRIPIGKNMKNARSEERAFFSAQQILPLRSSMRVPERNHGNAQAAKFDSKYPEG